MPNVPGPRAVEAGSTVLYRVCFVCSGNICRSPMAESVARRLTGDGTALAGHVEASSAGTGPWHEGEPMDPRARQALEDAGYHDHGHVARQILVADLPRFDLVVALDRRHRQTLQSLTKSAPLGRRLVLLRSFDRGTGGAVDVPDPYYGDDDEFRRCLDMVVPACRGLVRSIEEALGATPVAPGTA